MKIAFIINCHVNAAQVFRLFKSIQHENCIYLFHISKTSGKSFSNELHNKLKGLENVYFPKKEDGTHCEFGIVQATLNALDYLKSNNIRYDYASLISGQDYPLKSIDEILTFYKKNNGKQFLVSFPILPPENSVEFKKKVWHPTWSHQQKYRFDKFWIKTKNGRKAYPLNWIALKTPIQLVKVFLYETPQYLKKGTWKENLTDIWFSIKYKEKRKLPISFKLHGGLTWWNITKEFAEYVLEIIKTNPEYLSFFKNTLIPDEMFMQTILANSKFKNQLINDDKRHITWDWEINGTHPLTIKKENFLEITSGNDHFARKFDLTNEPEIFNLIDQKILKNERTN